MLTLLRDNVLRGTGSKADIPGLRVGGKTGSAQKADHGRYLADTRVTSFAAVFPTDGPVGAPRYLVLVLLDNPKPYQGSFGFATAGWNAAPTAGRVVERIAPFVGVSRVRTVIPDAPKTPVVIDDEAPQ